MVAKVMKVKRDIPAEQIAAANAFRRQMTGRGTLVVRLLSAPGSGKTKLLEATAERFAKQYKVGVLVGDVATSRDAEPLTPFAPTVQVKTGDSCHLEIPQVECAFARLNMPNLDFLFIEDVGNLICTASYDLGEHLRVVLLSTAEGDDKPAKYPKAFRTSDVLVITKIDLLSHVPFSIDQAEKDARRIQPCLKTFPLSALTGSRMQAWCRYIENEREHLLSGKAFLASSSSIRRSVAGKKRPAGKHQRLD